MTLNKVWKIISKQLTITNINYTPLTTAFILQLYRLNPFELWIFCTITLLESFFLEDNVASEKLNCDDLVLPNSIHHIEIENDCKNSTQSKAKSLALMGCNKRIEKNIRIKTSMFSWSEYNSMTCLKMSVLTETVHKNESAIKKQVIEKQECIRIYRYTLNKRIFNDSVIL